jgi:hypothetical protein
MRLIGAVAAGEEPTAEEVADAVSAFNRMVDSWNTEKLAVQCIESSEYALTGGKQKYSIGPTGDFVAARPTKIHAATVKDGDLEYPVDVIGASKWATLDKSQSGVPEFLYNDKALPNSNLYFASTPYKAYTLVLYTFSKLLALSDIFADLVLAPGYEDALTIGLAVKMAPEYGEEAIRRASALDLIGAKANIKRLNHEPLELRCDSMFDTQHSDIWKG